MSVCACDAVYGELMEVPCFAWRKYRLQTIVNIKSAEPVQGVAYGP